VIPSAFVMHARRLNLVDAPTARDYTGTSQPIPEPAEVEGVAAETGQRFRKHNSTEYFRSLLRNYWFTRARIGLPSYLRHPRREPDIFGMWAGAAVTARSGR
jgi:hypothetical protein